MRGFPCLPNLEETLPLISETSVILQTSQIVQDK